MTVLLGYSWVFWLPLQYLHIWLCCSVTRESSDYPYSIYICDCVVRLLVSLLITPTVSTYMTVLFGYSWVFWLPLQYLNMWLCCSVTRESSDYPYSIYICDCVVRLLVSLLITPTVSAYMTVLFGYSWVFWLSLQYLHIWLCCSVTRESSDYPYSIYICDCVVRLLVSLLITPAVSTYMTVLFGYSWVFWLSLQYLHIWLCCSVTRESSDYPYSIYICDCVVRLLVSLLITPTVSTYVTVLFSYSWVFWLPLQYLHMWLCCSVTRESSDYPYSIYIYDCVVRLLVSLLPLQSSDYPYSIYIYDCVVRLLVSLLITPTVSTYMTVLFGYSWVFWLPLQYLHMWLCCSVTRESSDYPYSIYIYDCVVRLLVSLLITPTVSTYVTVLFGYSWVFWLPLQYLHMWLCCSVTRESSDYPYSIYICDCVVRLLVSLLITPTVSTYMTVLFGYSWVFWLPLQYLHMWLCCSVTRESSDYPYSIYICDCVVQLLVSLLITPTVSTYVTVLFGYSWVFWLPLQYLHMWLCCSVTRESSDYPYSIYICDCVVRLLVSLLITPTVSTYVTVLFGYSWVFWLPLQYLHMWLCCSVTRESSDYPYSIYICDCCSVTRESSDYPYSIYICDCVVRLLVSLLITPTVSTYVTVLFGYSWVFWLPLQYLHIWLCCSVTRESSDYPYSIYICDCVVRLLVSLLITPTVSTYMTVLFGYSWVF